MEQQFSIAGMTLFEVLRLAEERFPGVQYEELYVEPEGYTEAGDAYLVYYPPKEKK